MIRRQILMPVSPERLWEALTSPEELPGWFGAEVTWELRPGGPARFRDENGAERDGRVDEVRPHRHLRFTWWPAGEESTSASEVSYVLEAVEDGEATRLTVMERRLAPQGIQGCAGSWTAWDGRLLGAWRGVSMHASEGARI